MGRKFFVSLALLMAIEVSACCAFAEAEGVAIRGKHALEGLACADCHKTQKPSGAPSVEACLECHGGYDEVAKLTRSLHANPHDSHLGKLQCLKCHRVHTPSEIVCIACHSDFDFKEK